MDKVVDKTQDTTFTPPTPVYGTTYKWRVDAWTPFGTIEGAEWQYTTHPLLHVGPGAGFTATRQRLLAAAGNALWYEDVE